MAEPLWANAAERNRQNPVAKLYNELSDPGLDVPELPAEASPASNPALNRSAETVGRSLGNAVAGARSLPRQLDKLRSRIHLVAGRQVAATTSQMKDAALETAAEWRDAAEEKVEELSQRIKPYIDAASDRTNQRIDELRCEAQRRIDHLRQTARQWLAKGGRFGQKHPQVVVGACAVAAFALGIALRVRRSNCD